ncbi:MAG: hypothetical protein M1548_03535 [Actinobacteria bacterium]|nr:hypothetical protein [Actinomycetota bacterium]
MILQIFSQPIVIFFFYGLAFFSMGIALLTTVRRPLRLPLVIALPWLAAFGIVHGAHEWIGMLEFVPAYEDLASTSIGFAVTAIGTLGVNAQELAEQMVKSARDFAGGKLPDDVVVVILKLKG